MKHKGGIKYEQYKVPTMAKPGVGCGNGEAVSTGGTAGYHQVCSEQTFRRVN